MPERKPPAAGFTGGNSRSFLLRTTCFGDSPVGLFCLVIPCRICLSNQQVGPVLWSALKSGPKGPQQAIWGPLWAGEDSAGPNNWNCIIRGNHKVYNSRSVYSKTHLGHDHNITVATKSSALCTVNPIFLFSSNVVR